MDDARATSRNVYLFFALLVAIALAVLLRYVLLVVMAGVIVGVVFGYPVKIFSKIMPRAVAVIATLLLVLALGGGVSYLAYQPLSTQFNQLKQTAPQSIAKIRSWLQRARTQGSSLTGGGGVRQAPPQPAAPPAGEIFVTGGRFIGSLAEIITGIVVVIVLAAFFAHEPESYYEGLRALTPRRKEGEFDELWSRLRHGLHRWVGGILISMTIMGSLAALGLWIAGVQAWPLLGVLTFLGTFVPYAGAISSAIPGLLLALGQSGSTFFAALAVYVGVHVVEGYIAQPIVMRRAVVIRPALLLTWQLVLASLCGILGIMVATPLLVCVQIAVQTLYVENRLGKVSSPRKAA